MTLERRTPLNRGTSQLKRTPLNPVSKKRQREAKARTALNREALYRAGGRCQAVELVPEVTCSGPLDVDEIVLRSGRPGGHLDPENVQVLCRAHHDWKHDHPKEAVERGLRRWSWE